MRRKHAIVNFAAIACVAAAFTLAPSAHAKVVERIVAIVNGDVITQTELEAKLNTDTRPANRSSGSVATEHRRRTVLDKLINQLLLKQAIKQSSIEVGEEDVDRAIDNIVQQNRMTVGQLKAELARKGQPYGEYREQVKLEIKKVKFVNQVISSGVKVSDRDLRDYFDKHKSSFRGGKKAHIAEIVLPIANIKTEEEAFALRDRAMSIVKQSREKPSAFDRLAIQYSHGPNAEQGGDVGVVQIDDLPKNVANVVKTLPAGAVSDPIPTEQAVIIVKVIDWPEMNEGDFNSMRDTIYQRLHNDQLDDALESYVQRMKQHAYIEIR